MAAPTNHWKLGLFVVASVIAGLAVVVVLGARSLQKELITYTTFFDESVQGLEIGSPVKFRGVIIGNVAAIEIAPDRRHVRVDADLIVEDITDMGLAVGKGKDTVIRVPPDLRTQLVSMGITGVKFLQIDYFNVADNAPPELPFPAPERYIPAATSVMKNIEDSIVNAVNRIPEVAEQAAEIMKRVNGLLTDLEGRQVPAKLESVLVSANAALVRVDKALAGVKTEELSNDAQATLGNINASVVKLNGLIDRAAGEAGIMANAERATMAVGDIARNATGLGVELDTTMRAVQDAANSLQQLTDALERDSDMLLKGRAKRGK